MSAAHSTHDANHTNENHQPSPSMLEKLKSVKPSHIMEKPVKFSFKTTTDKDTKERIPPRPALTLHLPLPTFDGLFESLAEEEAAQEGKPEHERKYPIRSYLMDLLHGDVINAARAQVSDPDAPVMSQDQLKLDKLTLYSLATQTPSERRGAGISEEMWAKFETAYVEIMVGKLSKDQEKASNAAKIFVKKLQPVRTRKPVLSFLRDELDKFFTSCDEEQQEEFSNIYEYLVDKIDDLLKMDDEKLLANL